MDWSIPTSNPNLSSMRNQFDDICHEFKKNRFPGRRFQDALPVRRLSRMEVVLHRELRDPIR